MSIFISLPGCFDYNCLVKVLKSAVVIPLALLLFEILKVVGVSCVSVLIFAFFFLALRKISLLF